MLHSLRTSPHEQVESLTFIHPMFVERMAWLSPHQCGHRCKRYKQTYLYVRNTLGSDLHRLAPRALWASDWAQNLHARALRLLGLILLKFLL